MPPQSMLSLAVTLVPLRVIPALADKTYAKNIRDGHSSRATIRATLSVANTIVHVT